MDVKAAAQALGCSPSLVYELCREKRLKHYRLGRRGKRGKLVIDLDAIEAFKEEVRAELEDD